MKRYHVFTGTLLGTAAGGLMAGSPFPQQWLGSYDTKTEARTKAEEWAKTNVKTAVVLETVGQCGIVPVWTPAADGE